MANGRLETHRVAVLMADGFETSEFTAPQNVLALTGVELAVVSLHGGHVRGVHSHHRLEEEIRVDLAIEEADAADFEGLFIPGGPRSPEQLRQSPAVRKFVRDFDRAHKPIAALCHGPWVLASSDVLRGRKITSWPGIRDDMVNAGASWVDQAVVRDGNLLTSRSPRDFPLFLAMLRAFFSESVVVSGGQVPQRVQPRR